MFFSFAVEPVSISSLTDESQDIKFAFERLISSSRCLEVSCTAVIVTEEMKLLYNTVCDKKHKSICLKGPPGIGKTTALYWLYNQLKHNDIKVRPVSFNSLATDEPAVILLDLISPTLLNISQVTNFMRHTMVSNTTVVIAQSSAFSLFATLQPNKASMWLELFRLAKHITFKPWNADRAKNFLQSVPLDDSKKGKLVEYCKGIPKLLSGCLFDSSTLSGIVYHEYNVLAQYMSDHAQRVKWRKEMDLVMAAKLGMKLDDIGMSRSMASMSILVKSYLISIHDDIPTLYFPTKEYENDTDCLSVLINNMWEKMLQYGPKPDEESVIGHYFEAQLPYQMNSINVSGHFEIVIKKLIDGKSCVDVTCKMMALGGRRLDSFDQLTTNEVLWKTPKSFKAIDFVAKVNVPQGLPDHGQGESAETDVTLVIQASTQSDKMSKKFSKSILPIEPLCKDCNVIFIMLNPKWTNFNINFDCAVAAVSGASRSLKSKFHNMWYGQPVNFDGYKKLYEQLSAAFIPHM